MIAAAAPRLYDGLPGILGLVAVAVMVAVPLWLRARRAARRTLARHRAAAAASRPVVAYVEEAPE